MATIIVTWFRRVWLWLRSRVRIIRHPTTGGVYLWRVYLWQSPTYGLMLHWFNRPDIGRHLHNHPWEWVQSTVLWGAYIEESVSMSAVRTQTVYKAGQTWRKRGVQYHAVRVLCTPGVLTLFRHGRRVRTWGFWKEGRHVDWDVYMVQHGLLPQEEIDRIKRVYNGQ